MAPCFHLGQEYDEFISRITNGVAALSGRFSEQTGHPDQGLITGFMAVGIVDLLEMVHVHHEQRHRMVFHGVPRDFILQIVQEKTTVVDTGELVFKYQARGIFAHVLEKMKKIFVCHTSPSRLAVEA